MEEILKREEKVKSFCWNNFSAIVIRSCYMILKDSSFNYRQ